MGAAGRPGRLPCGTGCCDVGRGRARRCGRKTGEMRANVWVGLKRKTCGVQDGTIKEDGWSNGTDTASGRCFISSALDNLVAKERLRRECRRDLVHPDHGLDQQPGGWISEVL